jgi:hypothetical protein
VLECHAIRELVVTTITLLFPVQKVIYITVILLQTRGILPLLTERPLRVNCDKFTEDGLH